MKARFKFVGLMIEGNIVDILKVFLRTFAVIPIGLLNPTEGYKANNVLK